ncbi:MAG: hypothetical protein CVV44_20415 [Spirochaetae bacterium HGW-Spirochaetae-1]|jgi:VanZ family protein|nr:MAG: hypothetical protein CVV44_20415 [Spirochaetae bacterium HGW-Spirochaetae-1]
MKKFKNQLVHCSIGILVALVFVFWIQPIWAVIFISLFIALTIEICQFLYNDGRQWKVADRILDVSSYLVGAGIVLVLYLVRW